MRKPIEYNPEIVDLVDVPARSNQVREFWGQRFKDLPDGKAAMFKYNNRQRAHQVGQLICKAAKYHGVKIHTRTLRGDMAIHGTDDWLLYFWKEK